MLLLRRQPQETVNKFLSWKATARRLTCRQPNLHGCGDGGLGARRFIEVWVIPSSYSPLRPGKWNHAYKALPPVINLGSRLNANRSISSEIRSAS